MQGVVTIFIYIVSLIVLSIIFGEIRFRFFLRKNDKKKEKVTKKSTSKEFFMSDIRPSKNCCNDDSYGEICIKCGRCGRKF